MAGQLFEDDCEVECAQVRNAVREAWHACLRKESARRIEQSDLVFSFSLCNLQHKGCLLLVEGQDSSPCPDLCSGKRHEDCARAFHVNTSIASTLTVMLYLSSMVHLFSKRSRVDTATTDRTRLLVPYLILLCHTPLALPDYTAYVSDSQ